MIVYDSETFNTDRTMVYANCIYRPSEICGNYNRDITQTQYEICRKTCIVFKGTDSVQQMLNYILQFNGEPKKVKNKIVKFNFYNLDHNGSDFDSYVVLNNLPQWTTVVSFIKSGSGIE